VLNQLVCQFFRAIFFVFYLIRCVIYCFCLVYMLPDCYRGRETSRRSGYCGQFVTVLTIHHHSPQSTSKQDLYLCSFHRTDTILQRRLLTVQVRVS